MSNALRHPKIAVVGVGRVGATTAYAMILEGLVPELALIDIDRRRCEGEAMDLSHGASFVRPVKIYAGDFRACQGADLVIIAAGASQKPGETRLDLTFKNAHIFKDIVPKITAQAPDSILLVVTNPVDILTYVTLKVSGFPPARVLGSGTVLDSSRFRHLLAEHCGVDARNIHAYVVGEHGDSEVLVWSRANVIGLPIADFCQLCGRGCPPGWQQEISSQVRRAAYEIIERKEATYYAVALAVRRIVESILRDEHSVLTVSTLTPMPEIGEVCLSLPAVLGSRGRERIFRVNLAPEEEIQLQQSARLLREVIERLDL